MKSSIVRSCTFVVVLVAARLLGGCVVRMPGSAPFYYGYGGGSINVVPRQVYAQPAVVSSSSVGYVTPAVPLATAPPVSVPVWNPVTQQMSTPQQTAYSICDAGGPCSRNDPMTRIDPNRAWRAYKVGGRCVCRRVVETIKDQD